MSRSTSSPTLPGPVRTCVGCRARAAKAELLRVTVGSGEGGRAVLLPDPQGTAPGRGAHLHPSAECLDVALRRKAFARALRHTGVGPGLDQTALEHLIRPAGTSTTSTIRPK